MVDINPALSALQPWLLTVYSLITVGGMNVLLILLFTYLGKRIGAFHKTGEKNMLCSNDVATA
jgi:hypothetical protein